jgi:hypothetical protein
MMTDETASRKSKNRTDDRPRDSPATSDIQERNTTTKMMLAQLGDLALPLQDRIKAMNDESGKGEGKVPWNRNCDFHPIEDQRTE